MGQAKAKLERRKAHARKIVEAFELFINGIITCRKTDHIEDAVMLTDAREDLIELLVTPPPKE